MLSAIVLVKDIGIRLQPSDVLGERILLQPPKNVKLCGVTKLPATQHPPLLTAG